jgi:protein involved in polysaccharide export with SLBB domain
MRISLYIILLFLSIGSINAQNPQIIGNQSRINTIFEKNKIDEETAKEINKRLLEKGIDINNLKPEQAARIQTEIEGVLRILKVEALAAAENKSSAINNEILNLDNPAERDSILALINVLEGKKEAPISKIYGHGIFLNQKREVIDSIANIAKIPDSYVLGEGDELTISIFGASQFDVKVKIGKEGYIKPDRVPKIFLKGVTWGKAKQLIQTRFQQFYVFRSDQIALSLSEPRVITVNIFGEVKNPGSYTMSAASTAFDALIIAGGPTEEGSVRNIKVVNDKENKNLDIYEFLADPQSQFNYYLDDNSIIHVQSARKIVKIGGAIQRAMQYELKEAEGLEELLDYAGGFAANAIKNLVQIKRFENNQQNLLDINWEALAAQKQNFPLQNGDTIIIKGIPEQIENSVVIEGAVDLPGAYALQSTKRLSDLISKGKLKRKARLDIAFLIRTKSDQTQELIQINLNEILQNKGGSADLLLERGDKLLINAKSRYTDRFTIKVKGAVRDNIEYSIDQDSSINVQRAILLAGGLMPEATDFAYIIRTEEDNSSKKEYIRIDIKSALEEPTGIANLKLRPLDELVVLAKSSYTNIANVAISGAVRYPGKFQFDTSLKLKDILTLAGGFTSDAALNRIEIYRLDLNTDRPTQTLLETIAVDEAFNVLGGDATDFDLQPYDEIIVRSVPDYEGMTKVKITGEVLFPGEYALVKKNETLSDLIRRAGGLSEEAFPEGTKIYRDSSLPVITQLQEVLVNANSKYNIILQQGDSIAIPKKRNVVNILVANTKAYEMYPEKYGAETAKIAVSYSAGKTAKWYIDKYLAGFGNNATKSNVIVEYPNGAIQGTKNWGLFKVYPKPSKGASISIGTDQEIVEELKKDETLDAVKVYPKLKRGTIINLGVEKEAQVKGEEKEINQHN